MSLENAKKHLSKFGRDKDIIEFPESSATVELAAKAANVIPARITKTLSFKVNEKCVLICAAGDAKIDNKKYKEFFGTKAKMLTSDEVLAFTTHAIGGVCPFGVPDDVETYADISLKRFSTVFPACGSSNSAIELTCDDLFEISRAKEWIDVCKDWLEND
ncbi:MAG: YbaK/EbsC family protein [Firmicutes bacterium]|nr:YbaK/EbsC family protein [Bacillota bacterium]